jgi:hypothetical protein
MNLNFAPLRFDPYQVFRASKTPAGLYARMKWLDHAGSTSWQTDFQTTVKGLFDGQMANGAWGQSIIYTVQKLFGLHLTVRGCNDKIRNALEWLIPEGCMAFKGYRRGKTDYFSSKDLEGLPFRHAAIGYLFTGATLFLGAIFGYQRDGRIVKSYQLLNEQRAKEPAGWGGRGSSNNILRAFVVHPDYRLGDGTMGAVRSLARLQEPSGVWPAGIPFYQTVNALAHLDSNHADQQLERALKRLLESQNRNGSWGRSQQEWNTFLVVHALKNKQVI